MFEHWRYDSAHKNYVGTGVVKPSLEPGLYTLGVNSYREPNAHRLEEREDELHVFKTGPAPAVLEEINSFWTKENHYKQLGVTHKRGILLHGPAGCGKTSIVAMCIKDTIKRGGLAFRLQDLDNFQEGLPLLRQIEEKRPIMVIVEDIDYICSYDEETLLEIMDGSSSLGGGILYLATTNKLEQLPPRIRCRPSRIDTLLEIGLPDLEHRVEYLNVLLLKLCKNQVEARKTATELGELTNDFSLAHLKEVVISIKVHEKPVKETIARLRELSEIELKKDDDE